MKLKLLFFAFLLVSTFSFSQQFALTKQAEVSVLTFGPGESLNDAFGHNAFRIKDQNRGLDVVFGYGEYDFDAPNFYLKFARGKLNYLVSKHYFSDIFNFYSTQNRSITEQILNFSIEEKQRLFQYLETNYKPENRAYLYDFFYNNCATKIRDVSNITTNNAITYKTPNNYQQKTFRELIYEHVNRNSWGSFGIDLALGSVIDRPATTDEYMFLPKYIHSFFDVATIHKNTALVKSSSVLYSKRAEEQSFSFLLSPLMVLGILALIILYITYKDFKHNKRTKWLDTALFITTGCIGLLMLLLWFATDHSATAHNYNLLWAFPLNIVVIAQLYRKQIKNWFKAYLKFLIIMLCLLTLHWLVGVQVFAIGLIPFLIALAMRYIYLVRYFST